MSFTRVILIALALMHATGIADAVRRATCEQECRDDGCGGDCTPGDESSCVCHCPTQAPMIAATVQLVANVATPIAVAPRAPSEREHLSPDPREILHVPRLFV